mmetsp:Transcript_51926/g.76961  ORF Transcript_51926/g.76961 Transcript_51926/m.76961 type:complete len:80 (+) Transcript_51926:262-501(+)|eukprot:CAMPEP_0195536320 /NCGR_PEP_ID=MMETSP0794_2-20130614/45872_1 /TAXON_ID=515487 /ORGANISM="Stephanopyxis turris, Strain CCMP 815" /LENGTH=79 /DNA_ID=CAMNT_0040669701 /DNA_START=103 /DNA_END=342 /DNA_ORIENTATION=+
MAHSSFSRKDDILKAVNEVSENLYPLLKDGTYDWYLLGETLKTRQQDPEDVIEEVVFKEKNGFQLMKVDFFLGIKLKQG